MFTVQTTKLTFRNRQTGNAIETLFKNKHSSVIISEL